MGDWLKNRVAVITGSGQGIGRAIAIAMAREGSRLVTNSRQPGASGGDAETTAKEIRDTGGQAVSFFGDISKFEVAEKLMRAAVDNFGRIDILVNNAGGTDSHNMVWDMTELEWDRTISVHLKGYFNCIRHAAGLMKEQKWGRILNATSDSRLGTTAWCNYVTAKAGVVGLTAAVARDLGQYGVTCNAYAPVAATKRLVNKENLALYKKRYASGFIAKEQYELITHPPSPDTVAPLIVYLCTNEAGNINGQVFDIAGGRISLYPESVKKNPILKEKDLWETEELIELVPRVVLEGYRNPAPVLPDEKFAMPEVQP